jgi:hypothetical protein
LRTNIKTEVKPGTRQTDPNYDGINVFGDEASASMGSLAQAALATNLPAIVAGLTQVFGAPPTQAQINSAFLNPASIPVPQIQAGLNALRPFYLGNQNNLLGTKM